MRLATPVIVFAIAALLYLLVHEDAAGIVSALSPSLRADADALTGIIYWLTAAWLVKAILTRITLHYVGRMGKQNKLPQLLIDLGGLVIFFCALLVILSQVFGQSLTGVLATSGALAAIIGFAVQKTISDMFAGLALNAEQQIKLGDWVETSTGITGMISQITWRSTHIIGTDGRLAVVPNSALVGNPFVNFSAPHRYFRARRRISVPYTAPAERVIGILQAAMATTEGIRATPPPVVYIEELGDAGIVYSMNFWVSDYPELQGVTTAAYVTALKYLDHAGLSTASPLLDITVAEAGRRQIDGAVDVLGVLRRIPLFQPLGEDVLKPLSEQIRLSEFAAHTALVRQGDPGESLFIVVAGLLDVSQSTADGSVRKIGRLTPGAVFGEMSLLTGLARSATVTTVTPTMLLEIGKQHLEPILKAHPEALDELSRLEAERLASNNDTLALGPEERQEMQRLGRVAFLRGKISRFFGAAD